MAWSTHTGTVRADQPRAVLTYNYHGAGHINNWYALGDTDDQAYTGAGRFHNRIGGTCRWYKNTAGFSICGCLCLGDGIKDWNAFCRRSALAGSHAANDICSRGLHITRVIQSLSPGYALYNHPRRTI